MDIQVQVEIAMEDIKDIKKIAKKYLKSPKIYKMRNKIQVVATSGAYMNLEHDPSGKSYEIIDPSDNLMGGGDYDVKHYACSH